MKTAEWINDLVAEADLKRRKLDWKIEIVPIDQIDLDYDNMGRIADRVDPEKVTKYGVEMLSGDKFPRIVLNKGRFGRYKYREVSGNHRTHGAKEAGYETVEAYVLEITDEYILETLPMALNLKHGKNVDSDEVLAQAKRVIDAHGVSAQQAAKDLGIAVNSLHNYLRMLKGRERLTEAGLDGSKVQRKLLEKVAGIQNTNVLKAVGKVITRFRVQPEQALAAIDKSNKATTEADALAEIEKYEKTLRVEQRPRELGIKMTKRGKLFRMVNQLANYLEANPTLKKLQITDAEDQEAIRERFADIFAAGTAIFGIGKGNSKARKASA